MIYIGIFSVLLMSISITNKKENKEFLFFITCFMILFLSLRFGQGTDYFNYKTYYFSFPNDYRNFFITSYIYSVEPFYYLLNIFAKRNNLGFQFVVFICALLSFSFLYFTISKYSKSKVLSVFVLFTNYFFYYQNLMRQSLAMSISLYAILEYINERKKTKYFLMIFIAMMFHSASIICLIFPIIIKFKFAIVLKRKKFIYLCVFCYLISFVLPKLLLFAITRIIPRYSYYEKLFSYNNIFPVFIRFCFSYIALSEYKHIDSNDLTKQLLKIYLIGTLIYIALSSISIFSRLTDFMTFVEIILLPNIFFMRSRRKKSLGFLVVILLFSLLFLKDLSVATYQDNYYSNNIIDYPYISVFNKNEITTYKEIIQTNKDKLLNIKN